MYGYHRGTCYTDSSRRTKGAESISAQTMDLHTDIADLVAKESFLDRMIEGCRSEIKNLTEDPEVAKYPFQYEFMTSLLLKKYTGPPTSVPFISISI